MKVLPQGRARSGDRIGDTGRSRDGSSRRRIALGSAAVAAVGLLATGCTAGQIAQTAYESPVVDGVRASVGNLSVNAASVAAPKDVWAKGSDAPLQMLIVNQGDTDDQLTGLTSPVASGAELVASSASFLTGSPTGSPSVSNPLTGSLASSASASVSPPQTTPPVAGLSSAVPPTTSGAPTPTITGTTSGLPTPGGGSPGASGGGAINLTIPAHDSVALGFAPANKALVLRGLTQDLYPATPLPVTFTFAHAGSLSVTIAVRLQENPPSPTYVPGLSPEYEGPTSASPS